jgi:hypothetical protein
VSGASVPESGSEVASPDERAVAHGKLALGVGAVWGLVVFFVTSITVAVPPPLWGAFAYLLPAFLVWLAAYWIAYWRRRRAESSGRVWRPVVSGMAASLLGPLAIFLTALRPVRRAFPPRVEWRGGLARRVKRLAAVGVAIAVVIFFGGMAESGPTDWSGILVLEGLLVVLCVLALGWLAVASIEPVWTIACPYCGRQIREEAVECPRCGASLALTMRAPTEAPARSSLEERELEAGGR